MHSNTWHARQGIIQPQKIDADGLHANRVRRGRCDRNLRNDKTTFGGTLHG